MGSLKPRPEVVASDPQATSTTLCRWVWYFHHKWRCHAVPMTSYDIKKKTSYRFRLAKKGHVGNCPFLRFLAKTLLLLSQQLPLFLLMQLPLSLLHSADRAPGSKGINQRQGGVRCWSKGESSHVYENHHQTIDKTSKIFNVKKPRFILCQVPSPHGEIGSWQRYERNIPYHLGCVWSASISNVKKNTPSRPSTGTGTSASRTVQGEVAGNALQHPAPVDPGAQQLTAGQGVFFWRSTYPWQCDHIAETVFWPELRLGSQYFVSSEAFRGCWPAYSQRPKLADCWVVSEIPPFDPCPPRQNTGQLKTAEDSQVKSYHLRLPPKKDQKSGFEETVAISHLQVIVGLQNQNWVLGCLQRHTLAPMPQRSSFEVCLAMPNPGSQCCCSRRERAKSKCEACQERLRAPISAWKICQGSGFEDHVGK